MDLEEIDRVLADDLLIGDVFRHNGHDYEVVHVEDYGEHDDTLMLSVNCLTENGDSVLFMRWDDCVMLLGLTATDLD